jgi:hypothetical protein
VRERYREVFSDTQKVAKKYALPLPVGPGLGARGTVCAPGNGQRQRQGSGVTQRTGCQLSQSHSVQAPVIGATTLEVTTTVSLTTLLTQPNGNDADERLTKEQRNPLRHASHHSIGCTITTAEPTHAMWPVPHDTSETQKRLVVPHPKSPHAHWQLQAEQRL